MPTNSSRGIFKGERGLLFICFGERVSAEREATEDDLGQKADFLGVC